MTCITFRFNLTRWCNPIISILRRWPTGVKSPCANSYSSNAWSTHENRCSMVHEEVAWLVWTARIPCQLRKVLKLGNNTLQKQVEKNAPRSNEGPPNCKMLTSFLFVVCSSINQSCYGSVIKCMYGLFGDSPCRDSRRDKNKSWGARNTKTENRWRDMEGIQTRGQKKNPCTVPWSFRIRKKSDVRQKTATGLCCQQQVQIQGRVWPDRLSEVRYRVKTENISHKWAET